MTEKTICRKTDEDGKILTSCDKCRHNEQCINSVPERLCCYEPGIAQHYIFHIGKYKGKSVAEVISEDAQYLLWMYANVKWFDLTSTSRHNIISHRPDLKDALYAAEVTREAKFKSSTVEHNQPAENITIDETNEQQANTAG